ncbi:P-type conjugative transfer protein TrbG [uncultured Desulfobacter sp.]|uniref:P-type conjugative transfer protein TrbG n=1 Tax=uncultured Desulfobacter sp. TaxID=240139 RepID=UPI0029F4E143|nr:P-type conjugative transfer protein TrbG [uncultured Desulfobacter sp.]
MKKFIIIAIAVFFAGLTTCRAADFVSPVSARLDSKERKPLSLQSRWQQNTLDPITTRNGMNCFVYGHSNPTIIVTPYKVADLELQPGEVINSMVLGDNARWYAEIVFSGSGDISTSHVVFKALDSGLTTTAVITTDRRVYHINLKSDRRKHMLYTGFIYPQDHIAITKAAREKEIKEKEKRTTPDGFDIANLNFEYEISGNAGWRPLQVFDNGVKTYIKLPKLQEMPMFMVKTAAGKGLVNCRVKNNCFIVDRIFDQGYLILGVGKDKEELTLTRLEAKK